jgi:hypothetical protein
MPIDLTKSKSRARATNLILKMLHKAEFERESLRLYAKQALQSLKDGDFLSVAQYLEAAQTKAVNAAMLFTESKKVAEGNSGKFIGRFVKDECAGPTAKYGASAKNWVIRAVSGVSGEKLWWSNEIGWVDKKSATRFTEDQTKKLNLPMGGAWERE